MAMRSVLDATRTSLELELIRAERLEARAQRSVTLAAAWFAVVQTVVTISLKNGMLPAWEIALGLSALAATVALAVTAWRLSRVWRLTPDPTVTRDALVDVAATFRDQPEAGAEALMGDFEHIIHYAQDRNSVRLAALRAAEGWWWVALSCGLVELFLAQAARLATV
jgi:hypothetical protein